MPDEFLHEIAQALEAGDAEKLVAHYADDAVFESASTGDTVQGKSELRRYFQRLFALNGSHFSVNCIFASPEMAAAEWIWSGLSKRSQSPFHIKGASIFRREGDKISYETIYYDPAPSLA